ncbi:MAG: protein kinase [Deltaproteobacteria bacterium]|nr:protein kinase [Deltaproteobacteria bacterium]
MSGLKLDGRYLLLEAIGEGGSGHVYLARHIQLGKRVAVKILHTELAMNEKAVKKFRKEALSVAELENEHIIKVYDFGQNDQIMYFAMEFLQGETLSSLLSKRKSFSYRETVNIISQLCDGLGEAHAMGFVHRDLRPRNIMLTSKDGRDDFVKILDFGLAKMVSGGDPGKSGIGFSVGDPSYTAPEQMKSGSVDGRADIYSIGIITYQMLTGHPPFSGENVFEIMGKHMDAPYPPIEGFTEGIPTGIDYVLAKCLSKQPENRYATPQRVKEAFESLINKPVVNVQKSEAPPSKHISYINMQNPFHMTESANMVRLPGGGVVRTDNLNTGTPSSKPFSHNQKMNVLVGIKADDIQKELAKHKIGSSSETPAYTVKNNDASSTPDVSLVTEGPSQSFIKRQEDLVIERKVTASKERKYWAAIISGGIILAVILYFFISWLSEDNSLPDYKKTSETEETKTQVNNEKQLVKKTTETIPDKKATLPEIKTVDMSPMDIKPEAKTDMAVPEDMSAKPIAAMETEMAVVMKQISEIKPVIMNTIPPVMIPDMIPIDIPMTPEVMKEKVNSTDLLKTAQSQYNTGQFSAAYSSYKKLLGIKPGSYQAMYGLSLVCFELGKLSEAENLLGKIVRIKGTASNYYRLGSARQKLGKTGPAISAYKKALSKNKNYGPAKRALSKLQPPKN